jgi:hypothetical protein
MRSLSTGAVRLSSRRTEHAEGSVHLAVGECSVHLAQPRDLGGTSRVTCVSMEPQ